MMSADTDDVEFVEQTIKVPDRGLFAEDGYVTMVERWEPAKPGEYAPMVVFNPRTGKTKAMKLVSRRRKEIQT